MGVDRRFEVGVDVPWKRPPKEKKRVAIFVSLVVLGGDGQECTSVVMWCLRKRFLVWLDEVWWF